jgi:hypothetical protein
MCNVVHQAFSYSMYKPCVKPTNKQYYSYIVLNSSLNMDHLHVHKHAAIVCWSSHQQ